MSATWHISSAVTWRTVAASHKRHRTFHSWLEGTGLRLGLVVDLYHHAVHARPLPRDQVVVTESAHTSVACKLFGLLIGNIPMQSCRGAARVDRRWVVGDAVSQCLQQSATRPATVAARRDCDAARVLVEVQYVLGGGMHAHRNRVLWRAIIGRNQRVSVMRVACSTMARMKVFRIVPNMLVTLKNERGSERIVRICGDPAKVCVWPCSHLTMADEGFPVVASLRAS